MRVIPCFLSFTITVSKHLRQTYFQSEFFHFVYIFQDLSEFGIAPKDITTTDDFASKAKDKIKEKARQIAGVVAAIPGTTAFDDLIGPSK